MCYNYSSKNACRAASKCASKEPLICKFCAECWAFLSRPRAERPLGASLFCRSAFHELFLNTFKPLTLEPSFFS